jgi:hypothetical protein
MPKRIRWARGIRGWRKPPNTVIVTRNSRWGNPFVILPDVEAGSKIYRRHRTLTYTAVPTREDAIACYWEFMKVSPDLMVKARRELKGYDLVCSCGPDEDCHADILLSIANA